VQSPRVWVLSPKESDDASDLHFQVFPAGDVSFPQGGDAKVCVMVQKVEGSRHGRFS